MIASETLWVIREIEEYLKNPTLYCGYHSTTEKAMAEYIVSNLRILRAERDFYQKTTKQAAAHIPSSTRKLIIEGHHECVRELRTWFEAEARKSENSRPTP